MDALNFAYWLNGFAELGGDTPPTPEQWASIKEHLALVFKKATPAVGLPETLRHWPPVTTIPLRTECASALIDPRGISTC